LVLDQAITSDVTTETDIGPDAARKLFEAAVAQLSSRGVVDGVGYDVGAAHMSRMMMGAGRMDESPLPQVKEYIFEVPRTINGIEVLGSGIRISVHKKGALASILVVDPVVSSIRDSSGVESPTGEGHAFQRAVAAATLDARVVSEFPNRQVRSSKVAYVLPDGPSVSVLAPQQVYILAPTFVIDGKIVTGRLERVSCLLDSPSPVATLWPKPNPGDPGDGMK
jgi:hypothetical protein